MSYLILILNEREYAEASHVCSWTVSEDKAFAFETW